MNPPKPRPPKSFQRKLTLIVLGMTALGVMAAGGAFLIVDHQVMAAREVRKLGILAEIACTEGAPALAFEDRKAAEEILANLHSDPQIVEAVFHDVDGRVFARQARPNVPVIGVAGPEGVRMRQGHWVLTRAVRQEREQIGTLAIATDLHEMKEHFDRALLVLAGATLAVCLAVTVLAARLLARAAAPMRTLTATVQGVTSGGNYALRAPRGTADELGFLIDGFNGMLAQIQARDQELEAARAGLERRVEDRTRELRAKEEQLLQAQKMEVVGRLAGGIAHDFNNLLTAINGFSELCLMQAEEGHPLRASLQEIRQAGERATSLTRQLLAFSRKQILQPRFLDLNEVITDMKRMLVRLIGENIAFETRFAPGPVGVKADPTQLQQVIMNLAVNARDAMPGGGMLVIETGWLTIERPFTAHGEEVRPGTYAIMTVRDSGTGMPPETLAHLFEPFFTTKAKGKGTGLGLSMAYGIIRQSGGFITVKSEVGVGTAFTIALPRFDGKAAPVAAGPSAATPGSGTETILVVEDETAVRSLARSVLSSRGYRVLEARDGVEGLRVVESHGGRIDLLLTDVVMPRMGGRDLAEKAVLHRSDLCVMLMSGFTDDDDVIRKVGDREVLFLAKPFTPELLLDKVRQTLDRTAPS